jgi:hypothetical protein
MKLFHRSCCSLFEHSGSKACGTNRYLARMMRRNAHGKLGVMNLSLE